MKNFKSFGRLGAMLVLAMVALMLVMTAPQAQAQFFGGTAGTITFTTPGILTNASGTNFTLAPATNANATVVNCYNARQLFFTGRALGTGTNVGNVTLQFVRGSDPNTWETNTPFLSFVLPVSSNNWVTVSTNVDLGGCQYVALYAITNAMAALQTNQMITNIQVQVSVKPGF